MCFWEYRVSYTLLVPKYICKDVVSKWKVLTV